MSQARIGIFQDALAENQLEDRSNTYQLKGLNDDIITLKMLREQITKDHSLRDSTIFKMLKNYQDEFHINSRGELVTRSAEVIALV
jgi:hypothetical protein